MYIITIARRNPKTGELSTSAVGRIYSTHDDAENYMRFLYWIELKRYGLKDNDMHDFYGNAVPGGYHTQDTAGVYTYCDYASGKLLEVATFVITSI